MIKMNSVLRNPDAQGTGGGSGKAATSLPADEISLLGEGAIEDTPPSGRGRIPPPAAEPEPKNPGELPAAEEPQHTD